ncbi:hypothetical protein ANN_07876 [Periplaneta americana]|uniref:Uncharacterized protein n=1 Tax=Periplaneta americana TaxID=6978 RepID=A0ABQ8T0H9_PERAM|nr:hypothetical protein ANN_07876 [Periplaneta americana]
MKGIVYRVKTQIHEDLLQRIVDAAATIRNKRVKLRNATRTVHTRADHCLEIQGGSSAEIVGQPLKKSQLGNQDLNPGPLVSRSGMLTVTPQRWTLRVLKSWVSVDILVSMWSTEEDNVNVSSQSHGFQSLLIYDRTALIPSNPGHLVTRNKCTSAHSVLDIVALSLICGSA